MCKVVFTEWLKEPILLLENIFYKYLGDAQYEADE